MRDKAGAEVGSPGSGTASQLQKSSLKKPFSAFEFWTTQEPTVCVEDVQLFI